MDESPHQPRDAGRRSGAPVQGRYRSLDALRGVAALIVVFHHARLMFPGEPAILKLPPLRLLVAGESAVGLFFLLSGFVLFESLERRPEAYPAYAARRVIRIYAPFLCSIVASALLCLALARGSLPGASDWARAIWADPVTPSLVLGHLLMSDDKSLLALNNVMWSLVVELRISLIFPLLHFWVRRDWRQAAVLAAVNYAVCFALLTGLQSTRWVIDPFDTGRYASSFVFGAVAALHAEALRRAFGRLSPAVRAALLAAACLLFSVGPGHGFGLPSLCGALAILVCCVCDGAVAAALCNRFCLWLGRVSYSLYLTHLVVLAALAHLAWGLLPGPAYAGAFLGVFLVAALAVAELFYRCVERPSTRLAQAAAAAIGGRARAAPPAARIGDARPAPR